MTFLLSSPFHSARLIRWILALQEYKFEIRHCKGADNLIADFFSRNFPDQSYELHPNHLIWNCVRTLPERHTVDLAKVNLVVIVSEITMKRELVNDLRNLAIHQANHPILHLYSKSSNKLEWLNENNIIYVKQTKTNNWKLYLPSPLIHKTLKIAHEQFGHAGSYKLFAYLSEYFFGVV